MKISLVVAFIVMQLVFGRKVSIPFGIFKEMNILFVIMFSFCLDLAFIPLSYFFYGSAISRIKFINRMKRIFIIKQKRGEHSKIFKWLKRLGKTGVALAPALPFTGGINLSIPLAHMLNMRLKESLLLISLGNFLGCFLVALASKGVISIFAS